VALKCRMVLWLALLAVSMAALGSLTAAPAVAQSARDYSTTTSSAASASAESEASASASAEEPERATRQSVVVSIVGLAFLPLYFLGLLLWWRQRRS
jgi:cobalamin biosynthesis Mg chelatase CobN